jgi:hypothetical protein
VLDFSMPPEPDMDTLTVMLSQQALFFHCASGIDMRCTAAPDMCCG